jgi:hypothetical protein
MSQGDSSSASAELSPLSSPPHGASSSASASAYTAEPGRVGPFAVHDGAPGGRGPVVVLFGWVGSTPRLVSKYAAALLETGGACSAQRVYSTTAPTLDIFVRPARVRALALRALELLEQRHAGEPSVLAYMSNGGAFVHAHLSQLLAEDAALSAPAARRFGGVRIVGTVFDSAPAYLSQDSMARAPTEAIRNVLVRSIAYCVLRVALPVVLPLLHGLGFEKRFWSALEADPTPGPSLYIYSAHDTLTDCRRLDALVAQRRSTHALGAAGVHTLRIGASEPESPHVQHLARHGARYRAALGELLQAATAAAPGRSALPGRLA